MSLAAPWSDLVVRCLARAGVRDVVVSPGSRSTPLVLALARCAELRLHVVLDERAAAFFALGQARVTGRPSVVLCTSGTAAAHHLPAVVEASAARVPLLSITANRPWEAQGSGASQTIDQRRLFGAHARRSLELGPPDLAALPLVPRLVTEAVWATLGPDPGAVHLDVQFRKPLEPTGTAEEAAAHARVQELLSRAPAPTRPARVRPADAEIADAARRLSGGERGVLACGPHLGDADLASAAGELADAAGLLVFAETTSGARAAGVQNHAPSYSARLDAGKAGPHGRPDVVVEVGLPPVSAAWTSMLSSTPPRERIVVAPTGLLDPTGTATQHLVGEPADTLRRLAAAVRALGARSAPRGDLADPPDVPGFHEGAVARTLVASLRRGDTLFVGNSGVTRAVDRFAGALPQGARVLHQRGAAGIDGNLAGLLGAASVAEAPVVGLVGDLAFTYDATSLGLAKHLTRPVVLVVVDNGGGRIFESLPLARTDEGRAAMDRLFVTPQAVDLAALAAAYGVPFVDVDGRDALGAALGDARARTGLTVVRARVRPPRETGEVAKLHDALGDPT